MIVLLSNRKRVQVREITKTTGYIVNVSDGCVTARYTYRILEGGKVLFSYQKQLGDLANGRPVWSRVTWVTSFNTMLDNIYGDEKCPQHQCA